MLLCHGLALLLCHGFTCDYVVSLTCDYVHGFNVLLCHGFNVAVMSHPLKNALPSSLVAFQLHVHVHLQKIVLFFMTHLFIQLVVS
jgi:hypothetical protein